MDTPYTQEQWYKMVDMGIGKPVPLPGDFLDAEWVYYRPWGVMRVRSGYHEGAMATLYAFHHGYFDYITCGEAMGVPGWRCAETLADRFLTKLDGTAFRSSCANLITTGEAHKLNGQERAAFRKYDIIYLPDKG